MMISENFYQDGQLKLVAKDAHKVVLGGTGSHTVVCDGLGSQFNILELTQGCENYTFTPAKCWNSIITVSHVDKNKDGFCDVCGTECGVAHTHDFSVLKSDETSHWYQCTGCDEVKDKAAHTWDGGKIAKPAACTEPGETIYTCTVCQATKTEPIPAPGHNLTKTEAKSATCTEPGNVVYYTCTVCKKNFSDEKGTEELTDVTVPAAGHQPVADAAVPATCTQDGKTEGSHCSVCGVVLTEPAVIKATGHAYGKWEKLNDEEHRRVCANDASHVETEPHTWDEGKVTKEATAEAEGETTFTCSVCGATRAEPIEKTAPEELTDPQSDITLSFATGAFSAGVTLRVQEVKDGEKLLDEPYSAVTAFDIATFVGDKQVQPKSSVTVKIPIPKGYRVDAIQVYHIAANGAKERMSIRVENGYIIFKADSFSVYAVVDTSSKTDFVPGDVDGDGEVTSGDARLALRASVKLETYESGSAPFLAADADGNGVIESSDARLILRASVKLEALPTRP
ncbi:MAG: dockerin type I repeat-containing protein [Clostridia bacterium]|nr:dockerin type I repeat-containing protein [Clostridia bacterium]